MAADQKNGPEWQELLRIAQGEEFVIERVRIPSKGLAVEGAFLLPQLGRLTVEDQVFVTAFVRSHGSIKEMERVFGVSYPTIKARLNRVAAQLDFVEMVQVETVETHPKSEVLERLNAGEISADEAIRLLEERK